LAQDLGDRAVEAQACYSLGNTYTLLRDYPTAIDYHLRHLRIAEELMDKVGEGTVNRLVFRERKGQLTQFVPSSFPSANLLFFLRLPFISVLIGCAQVVLVGAWGTLMPPWEIMKRPYTTLNDTWRYRER